MDILFDAFDVLKLLVTGFLCLVGGLFVLTLVFGKRIQKKWDYEANFRDERGRELGELDIELSRIIDEKADPPNEFELSAKFVLRHPALCEGQLVRVKLDGTILFEAAVQTPGRIRLNEGDLVNEIKDPAVGQTVSVEVGGAEIFSEPLCHD